MAPRTEHVQAPGSVRPNDTDHKQRLELTEEQLEVRTRAVPAGVVRLHKRVVSEIRMIEVTVRREELVVERVSADDLSQRRMDPADEPDETPLLAHQLRPNESFCIPLVEEEIVVQTRPTVVEEVVVGKRLVETTQVVSATVRREQARVETIGNVDVRTRSQPKWLTVLLSAAAEWQDASSLERKNRFANPDTFIVMTRRCAL
jgi:uncharacterized protein (TIGR02271 family)